MRAVAPDVPGFHRRKPWREFILWWLVVAVDVLLLAVFLGDAVDFFDDSANRTFFVLANHWRHRIAWEKISCTAKSRLSRKRQLPDRYPRRSPTRLHRDIRLSSKRQLRGQSNTEFEYEYVSDRRGKIDLRTVYLNVASPLGLWRSYHEIPPNHRSTFTRTFSRFPNTTLLARTNRLSLLGMRRSRSIGQDNEFERLRDYTQDDNFKHIDWRSTARRQKLTVRDFQANQSQQIIFMIDCGRMMTGTHGKTSTIDHAINAMLMLSYIALRQGDSVGLITFSNEVHNFTPPKSGVKHINRLLHATFDQSANHVESRYDQAFLYLRNKCPKRSLVVTITNLIDEINSSQVKQYMSVLSGRHLPFAVLLRDHAMFDAMEEFEDLPWDRRGEKLYEAAAAASILNWRNQLINDLKHQGILTMDVFPEALTAGLVNRYLDIKARHLL